MGQSDFKRIKELKSKNYCFNSIYTDVVKIFKDTFIHIVIDIFSKNFSYIKKYKML